MSKSTYDRSVSPNTEEPKSTVREECLGDFNPAWCQKLLNDPAYEHINSSTRPVDGPHGQSYNSLLGRTLFTDTTLRAVKYLHKASDNTMLALISLGSDMCSHTGVLHGGMNTTIVDEVAGRLAGMESSSPIMAVNFNVNLRKSVRAPGLILVRAWIERPSEGRKIWVKCCIEQNDVPCIEAEGMWLKVNMDKL